MLLRWTLAMVDHLVSVPMDINQSLEEDPQAKYSNTPRQME